MEKAKSKKKLIAIIAGAAMAFVLTVVVSVAATLAYFGQTKTTEGNDIVMGQELVFNGDITAAASEDVTLTNVLPGWSGTMDVTGTVKQTTTKYFLRVKLNVTDTDLEDDFDAVAAIALGEVTLNGQTLEKEGNYYYVVDGSVAKELDSSADNTTYTFVVNFSVADTVTNAAALKSIKVGAEMGIIQSAYIDNTSLANLASAWEGATI